MPLAGQYFAQGAKMPAAPVVDGENPALFADDPHRLETLLRVHLEARR